MHQAVYLCNRKGSHNNQKKVFYPVVVKDHFPQRGGNKEEIETNKPSGENELQAAEKAIGPFIQVNNEFCIVEGITWSFLMRDLL